MNAVNYTKLRAMLQTRNDAQASQIRALRRSIEQARIVALLEPYKAMLLRVCSECEALIHENEQYLGLQQDSILEDVLSNTTRVTFRIRIISGRLAVPVLRANEDDKLCLRIITWMHEAHLSAEKIPAAHSNGNIAVYPFTLTMGCIYYFPCVEQCGLLYLPLNFHELGHVFYQLHHKEMDDLVHDLLFEIEEALRPKSRRNDAQAKKQVLQLRAVVNVWYSWVEELFCDAVGLTIGGAAFLHAFSNYISMMRKENFYLPESALKQGDHPVDWLRVKFLARRARRMGLIVEADETEQEWEMVANTLGIREDYHGFYDDRLEGIVEQTIDNMLVEAAPRQFLHEEVAADRNWETNDTPVLLLNRAWRMFRADPANYVEWEMEAIVRFVA
jgi:hypothetical protein